MLEHFRSMQKGLVNVLIGLSLALLIQAWPKLQGWAEHGLFFATLIVLVHWHYGASFVLGHLGPSHRLGQELADSLAFFCLLALPGAIKRPEAWFALNAAAYGVAWLKYAGLPPEGLPPNIAAYVRRKRQVEVWAALACLAGAASCLLSPGQAAFACWSAFAGNLFAAWFLAEVWRLYDVEEGPRLAAVARP
jgi:hypothetical protein